MDDDYQLALLLQRELNDEEPEIIENTIWKRKENNPNGNKKTNSVVDPQWEFIDPTPDIHTLFFQFNERFFWSKLHGVEVKWSPRMTSCAGVCVYQGRSGFCSVRLSLPLLKLRPRKDLVETLLHEMIHAFLFVTKNNRDRDGHGPEFHKHMNRINNEAGTHITVYHSFHDEVRLYQQHWWRCNGLCQHRPPFFGMVRRSMNRAPGPYDNWWAQHEATCGGKFVKVKEPDNFKKKTSELKKKFPDQSKSGKGDIRSFFPGFGSSSNQRGGLGNPNNFPSSNKGGESGSYQSPLNSNGTQQQDIFRKPTMNNVHGFGSGKNKETSSIVKPTVNPAVNNVFGFRDLNGQERAKPSSSTLSSGKGYTLGGSGKPPYQRGGGAFGGMMANKGGGTLVVSGTSSKAHNLLNSPSKSTSLTLGAAAPAKAFTGTGHVLGKGTTNNVSPRGNASRSGVCSSPGKANSIPKIIPAFSTKGSGSQAFAEPSKRSSPNYFDDSQPKKKSLDGVPVRDGASVAEIIQVTCPVCNQQVLESVINTHLDSCIVKFSTTELDTSAVKPGSSSNDVIVLSDSEDEDSGRSGNYVDCPGCNKKVLKSELDSHLSYCVGTSFEDDDCVTIISDNNGSNASCPICGESVPATDMNKHLDNCASCSVQDLSGVFDEDFSDDEEEDAAVGSPSKQVSQSGERLYPCPCCLTLTETSKMNEHLDQCCV